MNKLSNKALKALSMIEDEFGEDVLNEIYKKPKDKVPTTRLTRYHLILLSNIEIRSSNECEFGAFECDGKRPYGNSDVVDDIRELTELPNSSNTLTKLHFGLHAVIKCLVENPDKTPNQLIGTDLKKYGLIDDYNKKLFTGNDTE